MAIQAISKQMQNTVSAANNLNVPNRVIPNTGGKDEVSFSSNSALQEPEKKGFWARMSKWDKFFAIFGTIDLIAIAIFALEGK